MFATETIQHQLHIRTYPTRLTEFHSRSFSQSITQILGRILELFCIYSYRIECGTFHTGNPVRYHYHFLQLSHRRGNHYIHPNPFSMNQSYGLFYSLISYSRNNQCVFPCRCMEMIDTFFIRCTSISCTLQIYGCKIYDFLFFFGYHFTGYHCLRLCKDRYRSDYKKKRA